MSFMDSSLPALSDTLVPPVVRGTADLTDFAYQGNGHDRLVDRIASFLAQNPPESREMARLYDAAIACQLAFRRSEGLNLQDSVLEQCRVFRVGAGSSSARPLRLLALAGPGDLMANTPLDFLTNHLNVRLDLLYLLPGQPLPDTIPDHDIAFFAMGEAEPETLDRLRALFAIWPRPALNDPAFLPALERDTLARSLAGIPSICSPTAVAVTRAALDACVETGQPIAGFDTPRGLYPCLIRPAGSHAGIGLARAASPTELAEYLRFSFSRNFFLTAFEDYSGPDGLFRKSRIAFIDRQPFLCHMAISSHWMVHYLNAGMTESAEKRGQEANAMARFDQDFAHRHAAAFRALHARLGFDFYSIDCGETRDGRLLVFEADAAAIVHLMDPADLFPYKHPQMHRVFAAFETMLRRRSGYGNE
jgi:hypothetical protein